MRHRLLFLALLLFPILLAGSPAGSAIAQDPAGFAIERIAYRLSMPEPWSHLFDVSVEVSISGVPPDEVRLQMPMWSPGRYAAADFAKNVQEVRAGAEGNALEVRRVDTQTWSVRTEGQSALRVDYRVFANTLSGTFAELNSRHANFNGHELFMYVVGHKATPVEVRIDPPAGWRIVNGRMTDTNQREWRYPNYDEFVDTPTEIGPDWTVDEFEVGGKTYRVVVHSLGPEAGRRPALVADIERIVRAQVRMWGAPDFDTYTFLFHFAADDRSGDGMEHLNSTQIIEAGALADPGMYESAIGTASHEFFHVWNVKRLRPLELGPWDFTRPLATRGLWIAEGVTNYYGRMMLHRAGIWDEQRLLDRLARTITSVENSPGVRLMSAEAASLAAPFLDAAIHRQRTNLENTSISYYSKGEVVALALDLWIRSRTDGQRSLDDVMRRAYLDFYVQSPNATYYLQGRGFTNEEFEEVASRAAGIDMDPFFDRFARDVETPPYDELFRAVGLTMTRIPARQPYNAGIDPGRGDGGVPIDSIRPGSAAAAARLEQGDVVVRIGDTAVTRGNWRDVLNRHGRGDRVPVRVRRNREVFDTVLVLVEPDLFDYRIEALPDPTDEQRAMRRAWLTGHSM